MLAGKTTTQHPNVEDLSDPKETVKSTLVKLPEKSHPHSLFATIHLEQKITMSGHFPFGSPAGAPGDSRVSWCCLMIFQYAGFSNYGITLGYPNLNWLSLWPQLVLVHSCFYFSPNVCLGKRRTQKSSDAGGLGHSTSG